MRTRIAYYTGIAGAILFLFVSIWLMEGLIANTRITNVRNRMREQTYTDCIHQKHPTLDHLFGAIWRDNRDGKTYNISGSFADHMCGIQ